MCWDMVRESIKGWPDGLEHNVHARRTDHGIDTAHQPSPLGEEEWTYPK
jgi:hypothetical protein